MSVEIANYWAWNLERLHWLGLICQLLGLVMFIALWWHQDRGWRVIRWCLITYFVVIGLARFSIWILYGVFSRSITEQLQAFMLRSGIAGAFLCIACIAILIFDMSRTRIYFPHFSPETWGRSKPSLLQRIGLGVALIALWWPFAPNPMHGFGGMFTWGFPTSFGITLTPTFMIVGGFFLAGSKHPHPAPIVWTGAVVILSAIAVDPITVHGLVAAILGVGFIATGVRQSRHIQSAP